MPETIKKGVIKKKTDNNNTVILYPKTTSDQIEYESKTFIISQGSSNYEAYLGEIIPIDINSSWSFEYCFEVPGPLVSGNQTYVLLDGDVRIYLESSYTYNPSTDPSRPHTYAGMETNFRRRPQTTNGGTVNPFYPLFRSLSVGYYNDALDEGFGHLFGMYQGFNFPQNTNLKIKILRTENCKVKLFDNIIMGYTNTPIYQHDYHYIAGSISNFSYSETGFLNQNIVNARNSVNVTYPSNNVNYYLTGTYNGSTGNVSLAKSNNVYFRNGQFFSGSGFTTSNTTYYGDNIYYYDSDDDDYYTLSFPSKDGTLATLADAQIPIEDLTNINNN